MKIRLWLIHSVVCRAEPVSRGGEEDDVARCFGDSDSDSDSWKK